MEAIKLGQTIQIQHLLKLNGNVKNNAWGKSANSNTTLVKVKLVIVNGHGRDCDYSNTTLVKVKLNQTNNTYKKYKNSNTTLVKVKLV